MISKDTVAADVTIRELNEYIEAERARLRTLGFERHDPLFRFDVPCNGSRVATAFAVQVNPNRRLYRPSCDVVDRDDDGLPVFGD